MGCSAGPTFREVLQGAVEELADTRVDPHLPEMTSTELEKQGASLLPSNLSCVLGTLAQGPPETKMNLTTQNAQPGAWVRKREESRCGILRPQNWLRLVTEDWIQ